MRKINAHCDGRWSMVDGSLITDQLYPSMLHSSLSEIVKLISCTYSEKRDEESEGERGKGNWEVGKGSGK